jgi:hypothetical protein
LLNAIDVNDSWTFSDLFSLLRGHAARAANQPSGNQAPYAKSTDGFQPSHIITSDYCDHQRLLNLEMQVK